MDMHTMYLSTYQAMREFLALVDVTASGRSVSDNDC